MLSLASLVFTSKKPELRTATRPVWVPTGTYTGRVAVRSSGSFDVKTRDAKLSISHKYCQPIHLMDGYSYA